MADNSAILNRFKMKLCMMKDNVTAILIMKFELYICDRRFFMIFLVFLKKQNGRQIRHFESDIDEFQ